MRLVLAGLISLCACQRPEAVVFSLSRPVDRLEGEMRHRLALDLEIGFDGDVEAQRWSQEASVSVRLERHPSGVVVRWLGAEAREGEVEVAPEIVGAAVLVTPGSVEPLGEEPRIPELQRAAAQEWARALELDALQVALLSSPVPMRTRVVSLDDALSTLCARALGPDVTVDQASLVLTAATSSVAVFDVRVRAHGLADGLSSSFSLAGILTVDRAGALPLSLALEGPVTVRAPQTATAPSMEGRGTFQLSRHLRPLEPKGEVIAGR